MLFPLALAAPPRNLATVPIERTGWLNFNNDYHWDHSTLHAGDRVAIRYDLSRAKCEHTNTTIYKSYDTFRIDGFYAINKDFNNTRSFPVLYYPGPHFNPIHTTEIVIDDLESGVADFWFSCQSIHEVQWDSNNGNNWVVEVL